MAQFMKDKIAFALALIAALFALQPFVTDVGKAEIGNLGYVLTIQQLYVGMSVTLFMAVYCYALEFLREEPLGVGVILGNVLYGVTISLPVFALLLFAISSLSVYVMNWNETTTKVLVIVPAIIGIIGSLWVAAALSVKDRQIRTNELDILAIEGLNRAKAAFEAGIYKAAVLESYNAANSGLRKIATSYGMHESGSSMMRLKYDLRQRNLISEVEDAALNSLLHLRNVADHSSMDTLKVDGESALNITRQILNASQRVTRSIPGDKLSISVTEDGNGGHQIMIPANRSGALQAYLKRNGVRFEITVDAVRLDGAPSLDVLALATNTDLRRVDELLAEWKGK